jgi:hypothetical protein
MGVRDTAEQLEAAIEECVRLERENAALKESAHGFIDEIQDRDLMINTIDRENAELRAMYRRLIEGRAAAWAECDAAITRAEDAERERDEAKADAENMRELAGLATSECVCDHQQDGPSQGCSIHGDITWFAAGLAIVQQERDALAAVIEQVRSCRHDTKPSGGMMGEIWYDVRGVDRILTTAPTDALETVKAEAWDEGVDRAYSGMIMRQNAAEVKRTNPHRKTDTKGGE